MTTVLVIALVFVLGVIGGVILKWYLDRRKITT